MTAPFAFERGELYHGDCFSILPSLPEGHFDLVYVDPPFNIGRSRAARIGTGQRATGTAAYRDNWGGVDGFLAMLEPRVERVAPLLSPNGSLWVHLDHRAVHDTKVMLDRALGRAAYMGEIIWVPGNGSRRRGAPSVTHQTILIYAPSGRMLWNSTDPALREPYADTSLRMHFSEVDESGRAYRERVIGGKSYRYYADTGRQIGSVWSDCPAMRANTPLIAETTGYPTQKPEKLLERIIRAASVPGSSVLDPMCGSGTTLAVAARLERRFVGIDQSEVAVGVVRKRLSREPARLAADDA
jgi:site-specific DNA-methyltransferase (adenine-specific)